MQQQKIRRLSIAGDKEVFSRAATLENSDGSKEPATQRRSRQRGREHQAGHTARAQALEKDGQRNEVMTVGRGPGRLFYVVCLVNLQKRGM